MIDNAHRATFDAIYSDRITLARISTAAEQLAATLDPDTDPGHALYALAGDAWTHAADGRDLLDAATYDRHLPAEELRAWLETVGQIIDRARVILP